jgi:predicted metal-dependent phosphoesterase TrpH
MGPREALAAIRSAGGLPVLAHFSAAPRMPAVIDEMIGAGLRGIEVHHRSFAASTVEAMREVAARHGLVASGGTDYHGDEGSYAEAVAETWVPDDVAERMLALLSEGRPARRTLP